MTYRQDDTFDTWPEVYRAGTAAIGLYNRCGVYCARELTDGHIPAELAASYGTREWVQKLVEVGLWEIEATGYRDVYYLVGKKGNKLNPTRVEALANLKRAADRTAKWRGRKTQNAVTHHVQDGDASRDDIRDASSDASPSLPPSKEGKGDARPASQGAAVVPHKPQTPRPVTVEPPDLSALRDQLATARTNHRARTNARTDGSYDRLLSLSPPRPEAEAA
jgi:hypothetical protein